MYMNDEEREKAAASFEAWLAFAYKPYLTGSGQVINRLDDIRNDPNLYQFMQHAYFAGKYGW